MGDMGDFWKEEKKERDAQRDQEGILCPGCRKARPKAHPTILWSRKPKCRVCGMTWEQAKLEVGGK